MGTTLTATSAHTRAFVDFTTSAPLPPSASRDDFASRSHELSLAPDASLPPPAKRQRVGHGSAVLPRRDLKECLHVHVLPHITAALRPLRPEHYSKDSIAMQALTVLIRASEFRARFDETRGFLDKADEVAIRANVEGLVRGFAKLPQFQIQHEHHDAVLPSIEGPSCPPTNSDRGRTSEGVRAPSIQHLHSSTAEPASDAWPDTGTAQSTWKGRERARLRSKWFQLQRRPYQAATDRLLIAEGSKRPGLLPSDIPAEPLVYHVDFTQDEVMQIFRHISGYIPQGVPAGVQSLKGLCHQFNIPAMVGNSLAGRTAEDVRNLCSDLMSGRAALEGKARVLSLEGHTDKQQQKQRRVGRIPSLLLAREMEGNAGLGRMRRYENFQNELLKACEDDLDVIAEFTNCAGDVSTISWTSQDDFIAGTTAHSDSHNQQYNKPGNLLLGSSAKGTLRAFADHRIPRPLIEKGENSTEAMRRSQDPWLYSSVVSSDYDQTLCRAFTSSFDKTVKVWEVGRDGTSMAALATWQHQGHVNFVAVAKDGSGRVATAADMPSDAVRIYQVNGQDIENSPFYTLSCSRPSESNKWAYYPATMAWGVAPGTQHLLLVGYSPRSVSGDDLDIPEDRRNSGEITLWDAANVRRLPVMTATAANIFEVAWHPALPRFIVATSPCGITVDHKVRTQVHLFQLDQDRNDDAYMEFQSLNCFASDVNELTIMPNALLHAYVTAACTDGNVYVWDTAQGDNPIHILQHGHPLDEFYEDREKEDTGVKFTAWGTSPDRFYTGASDGIVQVWNVRRKRRPHVRTLLEAPGPISCGAFSPDRRRLAIGDATGRVFLLSVNEQDAPEDRFTPLPGSGRMARRPRPLIPHLEPPPPPESGTCLPAADRVGLYARRVYLESNQLVLHPSPVIGATKGPEYASTGLFRAEAHLDADPSGPLLAEYERLQQESLAASGCGQRSSVRRMRAIAPALGSEDQLREMHRANTAQDLDVASLECDVLAELIREGAALDIGESEDWGFQYEEGLIPDDDGGSGSMGGSAGSVEATR